MNGKNYGYCDQLIQWDRKFTRNYSFGSGRKKARVI